jgi:hypothetical protein
MAIDRGWFMAVTNGSADSARNATGRAIWMALIVVSGVGLSILFACATPFAALAALAALKIERRDTAAVLALVWLCNQVVGYGFLGYPWTWDSAAWGAAIGVSAGAALLAAMALATTRPAPFALSLPFVGAFAAYELTLYIAGSVLPGGEGAFSAAIIEHLFLVNLVALIGLLAAHQAALLAGLLARRADSGTVTGIAAPVR